MGVNSHLLLGQHDAVLVDAQMVRSDAFAVASLIEASGRRLRQVILTHAHPDHFMGAAWLAERFPDVQFAAPETVVAEIRQIGEVARGYVAADFGAETATRVIVPDILPLEPIRIDDAVFEPLVFTRGESHSTLVLTRQAQDEVLTSDLLYSGFHLYLGDRDFAGWESNLKRLLSLGRTWARPGHGKAGLTADLVAENLRYLNDFQRLTTPEADRQYVEAELARLYPGYGGARLLRLSLDAWERARKT